MDVNMDSETFELVCDYIRFKVERSDRSWVTCPPLTRPPTQLNLSLRALGEEFEGKYTDTFSEMGANLNFTEETAKETFEGVLNEVFAGGVTWARIVAAFSFSGSLALQCILRNMPHHVDNIANWLICYINRHLKAWIIEHGGWSGIVAFHEGPQEEKDATWHSFRNFFCGIAAGAIGALTIGAVLTSRS